MYCLQGSLTQFPLMPSTPLMQTSLPLHCTSYKNILFVSSIAAAWCTNYPFNLLRCNSTIQNCLPHKTGNLMFETKALSWFIWCNMHEGMSSTIYVWRESHVKLQKVSSVLGNTRCDFGKYLGSKGRYSYQYLFCYSNGEGENVTIRGQK